MTQCPFCRSAVHEKAIVCPQCHAQKGYYAQKGQITTSAWTVRIVASILTAIAVGIVLSPLAGTGLGWLALAIVGIPALHNWWALVRGPKWFR